MTSTTLVPSPTSPPGAPHWRTADGSQIDVEAALLAYRAGDNRALQTLMTCFGRMMTAVARRYLRSNQDVEDAVQDTWISFVRSVDAIETPAAVGGWLRTATARAALCIARRQSRVVPSELALDAADPREDPDLVVAAEQAVAVRAAVARLEPRERELVTMLFDDEMSYVEIGNLTGRPMGSIGPTRQRVLNKLKGDRSIRRLDLATTS